MSRAPSTFRRRDLRAAVEEVLAAGVAVARVEVATDGTIKIIAEKPCSNGQGGNPWDAVVKELDRP